MIPILDYPPLVEFTAEGSGLPPVQVPFARNWLELSLREAAASAKCEDASFASHVAEGVGHFLRQDYAQPVLPATELHRLVRQCLKKIGLPEVAECFSLQPPPMRLSLLEVAQCAGTGYELHFFLLLSARIRQYLVMGARQIRCEDLRSCVKMLRQTKRWRRDCHGLCEEIVAFLRAECSYWAAHTPEQQSRPHFQLALS